MPLKLNSEGYAEYLKLAARKIGADGEYITGLDSATGDGDHWTNMNSGFEKLMSVIDELATLPLGDMLKKIGLTLMSNIGGSSGALYGSAYLAASKAAAGKDSLDLTGLLAILEAMLGAIMDRGQVQPGHKTMVDALYPAVQSLRHSLESRQDEAGALDAMKRAAKEGSDATEAMEAVRGRACYQANKSVGHIDPGSVTMAYQIMCLADYCKTIV